jgi:hypothetical protein
MVDAVDPFLPKAIYRMSKKNRAKIASPDIILNEENISIESMSDYIFDEIGGQELLSTARTDTIASPLNVNNFLIEESGSAFSNDLEIPYNTIEANLEQYQINIDDFLPFGYTPEQIVSFDSDTENLVIQLENLKDDYRVELRIVFGPTTKFGTIDTGSESN